MAALSALRSVSSASPSEREAEVPEAFAPLFEARRYKVYFGGRGGAKSWNFARALLIIGANRPLRVLCARELQNSIADSVHKLLSDQIVALGLTHVYEVQNAAIIGPNGTQFIFIGLRHNINNMKSYEGVDVCWVEEAKDVSKASWDILIPTIRKDGSEIWVSFNPELDSDETYVRFVTHPPPNSVVRHVTWRDNPWFPKVLREEMETLKARDEAAYENVWEGRCRAAVEGAIFATELEASAIHGRIGDVSYDPTKPVVTVWDLGLSDSTAIWFVQMDGREFRLIDFYQAHGHKFGHYAKVLRDKPYAYGRMWLPHDAANETQAAESSLLKQARSHNFEARIVPKVGKRQRIEAGRSIFPRCWFDKTHTADGLQSLRHYRYKPGDDGKSFSKEPIHDWSSHAADAFTYLGVAVKADPISPSPTTADSHYDPLSSEPVSEQRRYGRTVEHTSYDPLSQ